MTRKDTKEVGIGSRKIGGGNPILIQSMTNTDTADVKATIAQIRRLEEAGCDIVRVSVPDGKAADALGEIRKNIRIPLVADIHFDYRLAIQSIENGADKIRINPGNIGGADKVRSVVSCARERGIPIRVGVNSGSLEKEIRERNGGVTAEGLVESALDKVRMIEESGYDRIVLSIKSSDVLMNIRSYELAAGKCPYPLHVGLTEAGTVMSGSLKSGIGMGVLLYEGIGDTIRVSLTGDPVLEVRAAKLMLKSLGLGGRCVEVVSCPTCARTKIDLIPLAEKVEAMVAGYDADLKVAVMGCAVNGPGEARECDFGIAGGDGEGLLFRKGEIVRKVPESELLGVLKDELDKAVL